MKALIFPFRRRRSRAKFVVPMVIKSMVTISIGRDQYAPMLSILLEKPPVDRAHIACTTASRAFIPNIMYSTVPM